jgi:hypothetical protein
MRSFPTNSATLVTLLLLALAGAGQSYAKLEPNFTSNAGVKIYNPSSFFNTTGPWSLMSQAGDNLYIAGASNGGSDFRTAVVAKAFWLYSTGTIQSH